MNISEILHWRAELIAETFLRELGADQINKVTSGNATGDYMVLFGSPPVVVIVEVKATEKPIGKVFKVAAKPIANTPLLYLIIDVKMTKVYFGWFALENSRKVSTRGKELRAISVFEATTANKKRLKKEIKDLKIKG